MMLAVYVLVVVGLAALVYVISVRRGISPDVPEHERDKSQRFGRDDPGPG
jgi:hypothetical protein